MSEKQQDGPGNSGRIIHIDEGEVANLLSQKVLESVEETLYVERPPEELDREQEHANGFPETSARREWAPPRLVGAGRGRAGFAGLELLNLKHLTRP